jgi:hypothetical protein
VFDRSSHQVGGLFRVDDVAVKNADHQGAAVPL